MITCTYSQRLNCCTLEAKHFYASQNGIIACCEQCNYYKMYDNVYAINGIAITVKGRKKITQEQYLNYQILK